MLTNLQQLEKITPIQYKYLLDESHRFIVVSAGRRARKTLIAKYKIYNRATSQKNTLWFHGAPTWQQAKDIFWNDLKAMTTDIRACKPNESELFVKLKNDSEIHVVGLDKSQRIEGRTKSWNGCHIAEFADVKKKAWSENIRPVLADTGGSAILDGVPEMGNPWHRDLARYACGGSFPITLPYHGAFVENRDSPDWCFYTWFSADVLKPKEMADLKRTTDPKTFKQEYEGSYENLTGQVYYAFISDYFPAGNLDRNIQYDSNKPIVMGFDFNVNPMTAVLGHVWTATGGANRGKPEYLLFKGYYLENSHKKTLAERICTDYPDTYTFILTPCQSSVNRQTVAELGITDIRIIKNVFREHGKNLKINKRPKNPKIQHRVQASNSMLFSRRLRIKPDEPGLKYLTKDWEGLQYKEGTSEINLTEDKMLGHISAACDYTVERNWPVRLKQKGNPLEGIIV